MPKLNDCINCLNYTLKYSVKEKQEQPYCQKNHNHDGVIKTALNSGFTIQCNEFQNKEA
jgi:hypothetical protein